MGLDEVNAGKTIKRLNDGYAVFDFFVGIDSVNGAPPMHKSSPFLPEAEAVRLEAIAGMLHSSPMSRVLSEFGSAIAETSAHLGLPSLSAWWARLLPPERELLMRRLAELP